VLPDAVLVTVVAVLESAVVVAAVALVAMGFACFAEVFVIGTYSGMHWYSGYEVQRWV